MPLRLLVVTDTVGAGAELVEAIARAAAQQDARIRLVVLNPARAELHLLHPRRHDQAEDAELALMTVVPLLEEALGGRRVVASVSVRHDPMDAVEETLGAEPVDAILLHVEESALARRLHQDLRHRLAHYGLPVDVVPRSPGG
jgi:hypothetical protein